MSDFDKEIRMALASYASWTKVPYGLETPVDLTQDQAVEAIKQAVDKYVIGEDMTWRDIMTTELHESSHQDFVQHQCEKYGIEPINKKLIQQRHSLWGAK